LYYYLIGTNLLSKKLQAFLFSIFQPIGVILQAPYIAKAIK
ncbi:MAG: hypothetical protein ACI8O8_000339, partial [Oleiphilaceae bacterium]